MKERELCSLSLRSLTYPKAIPAEWREGRSRENQMLQPWKGRASARNQEVAHASTGTGVRGEGTSSRHWGEGTPRTDGSTRDKVGYRAPTQLSPCDHGQSPEAGSLKRRPSWPIVGAPFGQVAQIRRPHTLVLPKKHPSRVAPIGVEHHEAWCIAKGTGRGARLLITVGDRELPGLSALNRLASSGRPPDRAARAARPAWAGP